MKTTLVTLDTPDGAMDAYLAFPEAQGKGPALVIAQEAFGVNDHIQNVCRRFAGEGFVAIAPDVYHCSGKHLTFGYDDPARRKPFSELTNGGIEADLKTTLAYLRGMPEVDAKRVGIVGYCLGGFIAFLAACRTDVATAICFYGGGIVNRREGLHLEPVLPEADRIKVPVLCLFGDKDATIPLAEVDAVRSTLGGSHPATR